MWNWAQPVSFFYSLEDEKNGDPQIYVQMSWSLDRARLSSISTNKSCNYAKACVDRGRWKSWSSEEHYRASCIKKNSSGKSWNGTSWRGTIAKESRCDHHEEGPLLSPWIIQPLHQKEPLFWCDLVVFHSYNVSPKLDGPSECLDCCETYMQALQK